MAVGRAERFELLRPRVTELFGEDRRALVFELLELTEMAWHDCYGEVTPPATVLDDVFVCSEGDVDKLIRALRMAVVDWRDVRVWASGLRAAHEPSPSE